MVIAVSTWPFNTFLSTTAGRSKALTQAQVISYMDWQISCHNAFTHAACLITASDTAPYPSCLLAQGAYSDLASEAKVALSRNPDKLQILVPWPADIVEGIAKLLPPASLASLALVCHELHTLLDVDR
jgi:hypothetical protein